MTILHYKVSQVDHSWVVYCEDVPIEMFDGRKNAVGATMKLVSAANARGDQAILHIDRVHTSRKAAAFEV